MKQEIKDFFGNKKQNWLRKLLTIFGAIAIMSFVSATFIQDNSSKGETSVKQEQAHNKGVKAEKEQSAAIKGLKQFYKFTGFKNASSGHLIMILVGLFFIFLAIRYNYEPLLLIPIGTGILIGNIPFMLNAGLRLGIYEDNSVMNYLYFGVVKGFIHH